MSEYNSVPRQRRFRPRLLPMAATVILLPILVMLGLWQLDRAEQKRSMVDGFESGSQTMRLDSPEALRELVNLAQFQQVQLDGHFESDRQFLLDNMTDGGSAGYHVITPFRTGSLKDIILVDRGWIAKDFRSKLPPEISVSEDQRTIVARVSHLPRPGIRLSDNTETLASWPRIVQFPDNDDIQRMLGEKTLGSLLLLSDQQPDGYLRKWRPATGGVDRHMGYALQWFAMAATLLVIFVVVNLRKEPQEID